MSTSRILCLSLLTAVIFAFAAPLKAQRGAIRVESDPPGATVTIVAGHNNLVGQRLTTPGTFNLRMSRDPYVFEFSMPDHQSVRETHEWSDLRNMNVLRASLPALNLHRTFFFTSEPSGAEVIVDGRSAGFTPLQTRVTFSRSNSNQRWPSKNVVFRMRNYQEQGATLEHNSPEQFPGARLTQVGATRTFQVRATTEDGLPLEANLKVNGENRGLLPQTLNLPFSRGGAGEQWTTYTLRAFIENEFVPSEATITVDSDERQTFVLTPVTELPVTRYFPSVEITARGPRRGIDKSAPIGMLDRRDINSPAIDIRPITNFTRDQQMLQAVNSFCITPDGQNVIYSVTMQAEDGSYYADLLMKSANDQSFAFQELLRDTRHFDTRPSMSREEDSNLVVFQSNRGPLDSWDISSFVLRGGRVVGGIRQITRENRLNFYPFLSSEAQPVYFSSSDTFPGARAFISHTRIDGSSFTNLGEPGEQVHRTPDGTIFFARRAEDTGNLQVFSVTSDGLQFSSVINDIEFARANVHSPNVSPDGSRILFVSDYSTDEAGRRSNNIYIFDRETSRIQQVTDNGSDDIQPQWSPTEPGVIFFLSNRGGVYNIWRARLPAFD